MTNNIILASAKCQQLLVWHPSHCTSVTLQLSLGYLQSPINAANNCSSTRGPLPMAIWAAVVGNNVHDSHRARLKVSLTQPRASLNVPSFLFVVHWTAVFLPLCVAFEISLVQCRLTGYQLMLPWRNAFRDSSPDYTRSVCQAKRPNAHHLSSLRRLVDREFPSHNLFPHTTPRNTTRSISTLSCFLRALRQKAVLVTSSILRKKAEINLLN